MSPVKIFKTLKRWLVLLRKSQFDRARLYYPRYCKKLPIDEKAIFFESFFGDGFTGNPFYLLLEACSSSQYSGYAKYVACKSRAKNKVEALLRNYNLADKVVLVSRHFPPYCKALACAKYLVNNVSFPEYFVKREGQVYLNTWHGTPLKGLGRNIRDAPHSIGNVQRNFLMADYLLYPNRHSFEHIRRDYMLDQFYAGTYVLSGYPRNGAFFDKSRVDEIKAQVGATDKKVAVYMPTYRQEKGYKASTVHIMRLLCEMEISLSDDIIVFIKLHHLAQSSINLKGFKKVRLFPVKFETYDFLNIADCLITDYSSVMFDFINACKKIFLYAYDKEEYMAGRSVYMDIGSLPFQAFDSPKELCDAINDEAGPAVYANVKEEFCAHDSINAARDLLSLLVFGSASQGMELIDGKRFRNGKPNVLIFAGNLAKNGIASALKGLTNYIDAGKRNYVLTFYMRAVSKNWQAINEFRDEISYMPIQGPKALSLATVASYVLYFLMNVDSALVARQIEKAFAKEAARCYPGIRFDYAIHYSGYEHSFAHIINALDAKKAIYVHNNMQNESKLKNNIHLPSLKKAYRQCDKIVVVRESMLQEIKANVPDVDEKKIVVAHNMNNIEWIRRNARKDVAFDGDTFCNVSLDELNAVLSDSGALKFINIARFSPEKGLDRLIGAFRRFQNENESARLLIVGGYGKDFNRVYNLASGCENIVVIRSVSNPYPILAGCDCFVLSSHYEGLPVAIMEALILDKKVISTDIAGPAEFLAQGYGLLVENSEDGILRGMQEFAATGLRQLARFDAESFNRKALLEFEAIFE